MKEWRILLSLEYEWRVIRVFRKLINWLVKRRMKLSSPILCSINRRLDHQMVKLAFHQRLYESLSGQIIMYYKHDEI